jgi:hypothetical protein
MCVWAVVAVVVFVDGSVVVGKVFVCVLILCICVQQVWDNSTRN